MLNVLRNAWKIEDLRKKLLYTLFMLLIYRIGSYMPTPGVNVAALGNAVAGNGVLDMLDLFNGGALSSYTVFASGITPYITASIVLQLLTVAIPKLEALSKEGPEGQKKIAQITRYAAIGMALIQSVGIILALGSSAVTSTAWYNYVVIALVQAAGTALCMWIGERITENGIGNGISLLIFINIISSIPSAIITGIKNAIINPSYIWILLLVLVGALALVVLVTFVDMGERHISVQYAKRVVGRKVYGGQSTFIPMKVNNSGVMPIIFALTIVQLPALILQFWPNAKFTVWYNGVLGSGTVLNAIITALLIIGFSYFYSTISFNPIDISKNIQQNGGFIPGIRPGKPTSDYIAKISNRITFFSAIFLAVLSALPMVVSKVAGINTFGATSILIMVGVALETSKELEAQMLMRHYKGFLK